MKQKPDTFTRLGLTADMKMEIERISNERDTSQQKVMRMMIDMGIECHKELERFGLISAVDFAHYVKQALKKRMSKSGKKQLSLL